ncbi:hypothetical protein E2C01_019520 [Portunus trituberculatus]|uniref:Uncharacterized protein n=1 Tax=Portunus trituberculatus TaxID=210409 RepID=A0A5B7DYI1_PORTR|nr:hypothetical protein [Portunus trituberculatus]
MTSCRTTPESYGASVTARRGGERRAPPRAKSARRIAEQIGREAKGDVFHLRLTAAQVSGDGRGRWAGGWRLVAGRRTWSVAAPRQARHQRGTLAAPRGTRPNNPAVSHRNFRIPQFDSQRSTSAKLRELRELYYSNCLRCLAGCVSLLMVVVVVVAPVNGSVTHDPELPRCENQ